MQGCNQAGLYRLKFIGVYQRKLVQKKGPSAFKKISSSDNKCYSETLKSKKKFGPQKKFFSSATAHQNIPNKE